MVQPDVGNHKLERQLSWLVGFELQVSPIADNVFHFKTQQRRPPLFRVLSRFMRKVRLRRHIDIEPLQLHYGDLHRLAQFVVQGRAEAELANLNEGPDRGARSVRLAWFGRRSRSWNFYPFHLRWRPDAQSLALGPQPIHQRDMKAIELHARVKMLLQAFHNRGAQDGLGVVQDDGNRHAQRNQRQQQHAHTHFRARCLRQNPARFAITAHPRLCPLFAGFLPQGSVPVTVGCAMLPDNLLRRFAVP